MTLLQVLPGQSGTVSGILRTDSGAPAAGVRVAAMRQPESAADAAEGTALASITETDGDGRYALENIPPGRYYISAGRIDHPTFFPGTESMSAGTIVTVAPGSTQQGVDFRLNAASAGRASSGIVTIVPVLTIPLEVRVENGGRVPVFTNGKFAELRLFPATPLRGMIAPPSVPLTSPTVDAFGPVADYRVEVANLPEGYAIRSVFYGSKDLTGGTLKLSAADFPASSTVGVLTGGTFLAPSALTAVRAYLVPQAVAGSASTLSITLTAGAAANRSPQGVRVKGKTQDAESRSVYLGGKPGTLYTDGTFEFDGVRPGRYFLMSLDNPVRLGASVVVGNGDLEGVEMKEVAILPPLTITPKAMETAPSRSAVLPLAAVRGGVMEETSRVPVREGEVLVRGYRQTARFPIDKDGRFEISLFPGIYDFAFEIFGHTSIRETIVVEDSDVTLNVTPRRLF